MEKRDEKFYNYPRSSELRDLKSSKDWYGFETIMRVRTVEDNSRQIVYVEEIKETNDRVQTANGYTRLNEHTALIHGYSTQESFFLGLFKRTKIKEIPSEEKESVINLVREDLGERLRTKYPGAEVFPKEIYYIRRL